MATPLTAANAYAALAKMTDRTGGGAMRATDPGNSGMDFGAVLKTALAGVADGGAMRAAEFGGNSGTDFGSVLKSALGGVADAGRASEAQTQALAAGKANIVDVVTAVSETEVALQTLVSVRDRVIQSYEEIMRMPI